jgi:hypothetical protein
MIEIKVLKDYAEVAYQQPGTSKYVKKIIGVSEIPALFETKITYDSGILPVFGQQNAYGVQRIIQKDNALIVLVQAINPYVNVLHTEKATLSEEDRNSLGISHIKTLNNEIIESKNGHNCYKNIYFPNLLMSLFLKKDRYGKFSVANSGILGFQDPFITENTQLYDLPYSNIYRGGSHGGICWGDQRLEIENLAQSVSAIHTFLGGVMNTHLFSPFNIKDFEVDCSSEMLAYLSLRAPELSRFPYEDIQLSPLIKYKGLIAYLNENWK